jgi:hypothetical protein
MSKLEVDAIEPQSGTTLTIGANGDTVNIASGATITDFTSTGIDDNATSTAITIDSSQNVGIGTSSPKGAGLSIGTTDATAFISPGGNNNSFTLATTGANGVIRFYTQGGSDGNRANTESMRIDSSGDVFIGASSFSSGSRGKQFEINANAVALRSGCAVTTTAFHNEFHNPNGAVGSIRTSGSSTSFVTTSDYRLKENVNYDFDATTRLKQLKPARFNFIADANTTVDGFLAHEVSSIVPEAISGEKDATETKEKVVVNANGNVIAENIEQADWEAGKIADENGNTKYPTDSTWEATKVVPVYQGIDQAKLVPLLVKTIQELEARITALENA